MTLRFKVYLSYGALAGSGRTNYGMLGSTLVAHMQMTTTGEGTVAATSQIQVPR